MTLVTWTMKFKNTIIWFNTLHEMKQNGYRINEILGHKSTPIKVMKILFFIHKLFTGLQYVRSWKGATFTL